MCFAFADRSATLCDEPRADSLGFLHKFQGTLPANGTTVSELAADHKSPNKQLIEGRRCDDLHCGAPTTVVPSSAKSMNIGMPMPASRLCAVTGSIGCSVGACERAQLTLLRIHMSTMYTRNSKRVSKMVKGHVHCLPCGTWYFGPHYQAIIQPPPPLLLYFSFS